MTSPSDSGEPAVTDRPTAFAVEPAPLLRAPGVLVRGELDIDTAPKLTAAADAEARLDRGSTPTARWSSAASASSATSAPAAPTTSRRCRWRCANFAT